MGTEAGIPFIGSAGGSPLQELPGLFLETFDAVAQVWQCCEQFSFEQSVLQILRKTTTIL
jgi:hypothetical protein